jgi:hypothetical protein
VPVLQPPRQDAARSGGLRPCRCRCCSWCRSGFHREIPLWWWSASRSRTLVTVGRRDRTRREVHRTDGIWVAQVSYSIGSTAAGSTQPEGATAAGRRHVSDTATSKIRCTVA